MNLIHWQPYKGILRKLLNLEYHLFEVFSFFLISF